MRDTKPMVHLTAFILFCVLLAWRWPSIRQQPTRSLRTEFIKELVGVALIFVVPAAGFAVLYVLADLFGPIPQIHEW